MARLAVTRVQLRKAGNFSVEGLDEVYDKLDGMLDKTRAESLKKTFFEAGVILRDRAKANAPVRTGKLRNAIFCAPGKPSEPNVLVGVSRSKQKTGSPSAPHGILIEYGTSRMAAQPFMRPAIAQTRPQIASKIIGDIQDIVTTEFNK